MTNQKTKKLTRSQAEVLAQELKELSEKMKSTAWRIHYYGGMAAESQMRARELSGAADMVYKWALEVKKEATK
jgi:hypothetical protein